MEKYDVIVIGVGHAGIEAAFASSAMGANTLVMAMDLSTIGALSCNPAIGGVGKGQLVKEIDALGGIMPRAADFSGMQFRVLNASKGEAVHSSRAQVDKYLYKDYMTRLLQDSPGISLREGEVTGLIVEGNRVSGVKTAEGQLIGADCVIICTGTFLDGTIHVGLEHFTGGRIGEPAATGLGADLKRLGFDLLRFKTGTCPRLDKNSIDYSGLTVQEGDSPPRPFSFFTSCIRQKQLPCHITYTNPVTHKIILDNLDRSPLYTGKIKATGVRYCPSVEDKIVKFADKSRHQVFLEPEGYDTNEVYPNGLATSLPKDVQLSILHSIPGLEKAEVLRFGYGIEHTVVVPTQLYPSLETKLIKNLFLAGQINGTTGYEEAAAQGLVAGINAALSLRKEAPFILDRSTSYIGVLIDDLTTKGTSEPYRMFTSRVEYRLILREDNAVLRLGKFGRKLGLLDKEKYRIIEEKEKELQEGMKALRSHRLKPCPEVNSMLERLGTAPIRKALTLEELLRRPGIALKDLAGIPGVFRCSDFVSQQLEIEVKYAGFIERQLREVERFRNLEHIRIPDGFDYSALSGLSREIREKLQRFKPVSLGQASRISGVTPAAISLLIVYLRKLNAKK